MPKIPPHKGQSKSLSDAICELQRHKIAEQKVVSLDEYRVSSQKHSLKSILIVDGDETLRNSLQRFVETEGYKVYVASDAMELSDILERHMLNLIILEVELPWVNGLELCEILKSHREVSSIPVILTSEKTTAPSTEALNLAKCDQFLAKPLNGDILKQSLDLLLKS